MRKKVQKEVIGWKEYIDLPDWGIRKLRAKIDTGARSSSLHVEDIKEISDSKISFNVILGNRKKKRITAKPVRKGKVKSSIGTKTQRWYVETKLKLGHSERVIRVNLAGREDMNFRMLIGRTAIEDDFLVDAKHGYLFNKTTSKKNKLVKKVKRVKE